MDTLADRQRPLGSVVGELSATVTMTRSVDALMATFSVAIPVSLFGLPADDQTPFEREKAAFLRKRPYLRQYTGEFVAIHGGEVVASDKSRNEVLQKFFGKYPARTSVYIGFVGSKPVARVSPHFFVRRTR